MELQPIGFVRTDGAHWDHPYPFYLPARIELKPEYAPALENLERNSHIWVICLFDHERPPKLTVRPRQIDPTIEPFGVLALRAPNHPNPLGLTLVPLTKVEGSTVFVENLDAYDGTPVLDIKPYYERDSIFSPRLPDIRHKDAVQRRNHLLMLALNHHQELCTGCALAVQMALYAESRYGFNLCADNVRLEVSGNPCLADALQGITRARFANPARFIYHITGPEGCIWQVPGHAYMVVADQKAHNLTAQQILEQPPHNLFADLEL